MAMTALIIAVLAACLSYGNAAELEQQQLEDGPSHIRFMDECPDYKTYSSQNQ
jgi:hypothetical protein